MFVSGFTIVRNARRFDYPVIESIRSMLPLCDEVVVAVGKSDDDTLQMVQSIADPRIRIVETTWDDALREGGQVLAIETDKALAATNPEATWCLYLQADEVLHEADYPNIRAAMQRRATDQTCEGLLFKYRHFYGTYQYIGDSRQWYRNEIRIIRRQNQTTSYRDAQGFRRVGQKLRVRSIEAYIHHYGWVRHPEKQQQRVFHFQQYWHPEDWIKANFADSGAWNYAQVDSLIKYTGTHPETMQERIVSLSWDFEFATQNRQLPFKERVSRWAERVIGIRFGEYKNYQLIGPA